MYCNEFLTIFQLTLNHFNKIVFVAPEDEAAIKEMRRLYDKVEEMKGQRQRLEQQFREELLKDDVTAVLVTQGDKNQEVLYSCEIVDSVAALLNDEWQ